MGRCYTSILAKYSLFGAYLMELEELHKMKSATLYGLQVPLRGFVIFDYIGMHTIGQWAGKDSGMASVLGILAS